MAGPASTAARTGDLWRRRRSSLTRRGSPDEGSPSSCRTAGDAATRPARSRRSSTRHADGATTIEWAARLPFSDGRVATYGFSYQGLAQLYAAARRPPSLKAIAPMMCCPDPYEGWTYEGGLLRWPFVCFWSAQLAGQDRRIGPIPFDLGAVPISGALGADAATLVRGVVGPSPRRRLLGCPTTRPRRHRRPGFHGDGLVRRLLVGHRLADRSTRRRGMVRAVGTHAVGNPTRWRRARPGGIARTDLGCPRRLLRPGLRARCHRCIRRLVCGTSVIGDGWREAASWPPPHTIRTMAGHSTTGTPTRGGATAF